MNNYPIRVSASASGIDVFDLILGAAFMAYHFIPQNYFLLKSKKKNSKLYVQHISEITLTSLAVILTTGQNNQKVVQRISLEDMVKVGERKFKFFLEFQATLSQEQLPRIMFWIEYKNNVSGIIQQYSPPIAVPLYDGGRGTIDEKMERLYATFNRITGSNLVMPRSPSMITQGTASYNRRRGREDATTSTSPSSKRSRHTQNSSTVIVPTLALAPSQDFSHSTSATELQSSGTVDSLELPADVLTEFEQRLEDMGLNLGQTGDCSNSIHVRGVENLNEYFSDEFLQMPDVVFDRKDRNYEVTDQETTSVVPDSLLTEPDLFSGSYGSTNNAPLSLQHLFSIQQQDQDADVFGICMKRNNN